MNHVEKCPVCEGRGWVIASDDLESVTYLSMPLYSEPNIIQWNPSWIIEPITGTPLYG